MLFRESPPASPVMQPAVNARSDTAGAPGVTHESGSLSSSPMAVDLWQHGPLLGSQLQDDNFDTASSCSGSSLSTTESLATQKFEKKMLDLAHHSSAGVIGSGWCGAAPHNARGKSLGHFGGDGVEVADLVVELDEFTATAGDGDGTGMSYIDEEDWDELTRNIDSAVRVDTHYYEYPTADYFKLFPLQQQTLQDVEDEQVGTKMFLGGMRFEVVQMGRHMICWIIEVACGVKLPQSAILIHRKSRNGKAVSPTGCASIFVANEADVEYMLAMNQRIFCAEKGIHVASSVEKMNELIQSKAILDVVDGRVRGPTHPMIIERAYKAQSAPTTGGPAVGSRQSTRTPSVDLNSTGSYPVASASGGYASRHSSSAPHSLSSSPAQPSLLSTIPGCSVALSGGEAAAEYHPYPGDTHVAALVAQTPELREPTQIFMGGLCYEATRDFVAWLFTFMGVQVHPSNAALYVDSHTGGKRGCALVRIEDSDFTKAASFSRRMMCDPHGVYVASSPSGIVALQAARDPGGRTHGPSHPVIIERRRKHNSVMVGGVRAAGAVVGSPPTATQPLGCAARPAHGHDGAGTPYVGILGAPPNPSVSVSVGVKMPPPPLLAGGIHQPPGCSPSVVVGGASKWLPHQLPPQPGGVPSAQLTRKGPPPPPPTLSVGGKTLPPPFGQNNSLPPYNAVAGVSYIPSNQMAPTGSTVWPVPAPQQAAPAPSVKPLTSRAVPAAEPQISAPGATAPVSASGPQIIVGETEPAAVVPSPQPQPQLQTPAGSAAAPVRIQPPPFTQSILIGNQVYHVPPGSSVQFIPVITTPSGHQQALTGSNVFNMISTGAAAADPGGAAIHLDPCVTAAEPKAELPLSPEPVTSSTPAASPPVAEAPQKTASSESTS